MTLLSGANSSGKSSVLQGLVLLHQTMREHEWSTRLMLNGDSISLGTVADVVDKVNGRFSMAIGVRTSLHSYFWKFRGDRSDMSMAVDSLAVDGDEHPNPKVLHNLMPLDAAKTLENTLVHKRLHGLTYITAERVGPRNYYPLDDLINASIVGPAGEHAVSVLHGKRDELVLSDLVLQKAPPTLLRQVEARMEVLFPGCEINLTHVPQADSVLLGMRTSADTDYHRPIHVGFGFTQVFPIVVAALAAREGDILLIENPEVHLHPFGQATMGQFLSQVAAAGVQVVVETHSDHLLNGMRRAVKLGQLAAENAAIHFFRPRGGEEAQVVSPMIESSGKIDYWPSGFFDQFDKDTAYFADWD